MQLKSFPYHKSLVARGDRTEKQRLRKREKEEKREREGGGRMKMLRNPQSEIKLERRVVYV